MPDQDQGRSGARPPWYEIAALAVLWPAGLLLFALVGAYNGVREFFDGLRDWWTK